MVGFDDAAMMGLGAVNAGVQIYGQQLQQRGQRKLDRLSKATRFRKQSEVEEDARLQHADISRANDEAQLQNRNELGDQQGYGGSEQRRNARLMNEDSSRRHQALDRQLTRLRADWADEDRVRSIQKKMAKNQRTMGMISSLLLQGASGAGGMLGGSTMAGG